MPLTNKGSLLCRDVNSYVKVVRKKPKNALKLKMLQPVQKEGADCRLWQSTPVTFWLCKHKPEQHHTQYHSVNDKGH